MGCFQFEGATNLRLRVVCSALSGQGIRIMNIRANDPVPGMKEYEVSFIRLIEKLSNGAVIEINKTGTTLYFCPGTLIGGSITHQCDNERSIGYYLEPLVMLAPFMKESLTATLNGITTDDHDIGVDAIRSMLLPYVSKFIGTEDGLDLKIVSRGCAPLGGGEVVFTCPKVAQLNTINMPLPAKVRRVRGITYSCRVPPSLSQRLAHTTKDIFQTYLSDVFVYTDHRKGTSCGLSPGFGVTLIAETSNGVLYSAQCSGKGGEIAEDVGTHCAQLLLCKISEGGCACAEAQPLILLFMALGSKNVSSIYFGKLSTQAVEALRLYKDFFGVVFRITVDTTKQLAKLSCFGAGFTNLAKKLY